MQWRWAEIAGPGIVVLAAFALLVPVVSSHSSPAPTAQATRDARATRQQATVVAQQQQRLLLVYLDSRESVLVRAADYFGQYSDELGRLTTPTSWTTMSEAVSGIGLAGEDLRRTYDVPTEAGDLHAQLAAFGEELIRFADDSDRPSLEHDRVGLASNEHRVPELLSRLQSLRDSLRAHRAQVSS